MPDDTSAPSRSARRWRGLHHRFGRGGTLLLGVVALLLIGAVAFTIQAEKPWGRTVQKRLDKNEPLKTQEHAIIGLWWAAAINAGVLVLLLGTAGKWMPGKDSQPSGLRSQVEEGSGMKRGAIPKRWIWPLVLAAVVFGGWERWPRLAHSFWNDEAYALKRFVHGAWEKQKDGSIAFEPVTWTDTLFKNNNGNNHLLNSLVSRVSLEVWRSLAGAPREAFSETAGRMPNLLAGLATILMMFLLGRELGSPLAGVGAAWLLALHPWHIRYAVEMRGYALMLFFVGLAMFSLVRALRTDALRWWLLFALSEAMFLLSFPGALYVALMINGLCAADLLFRREWRTTARLVAFNLLAAALVLQWILPSIPQIRAWLREGHPEYVPDPWLWLHDLGSVIVTGWQYDNPWRELHVGTDWKGVMPGFPLPPWVMALILAGLVLTGLVLAFRRGVAGRVILIAPVLAAALSLALNLYPGSPMTVWYLLFLLIPASLGAYLTLEAAGQWKNLRWLPLALCAWFTFRYSMGTETARRALREHDRQPMRQTASFIHAQSPEATTATFGVSDLQHSAYDSRVEVLNSASDLDGSIVRSRAASRPLYVYYCSDEHGRKRNPDIFERVVKGGDFERVTAFPGSEELWSYRVYRLRGEK